MYGLRITSCRAIVCSTIICLLALISIQLRRNGITSFDGQSPTAPPAPELRVLPLKVKAQTAFAESIPYKELQRALKRLEPYWEYQRASDAIHALRLWGPDCCFPDTPPFPVPSGVKPWHTPEMLKVFLSEKAFRERFPFQKAHFFPSSSGLGARRKFDDPAATPHHDDFLHLAAEIGLRVDTKMIWDGRPFTLMDLFSHSFFWYHPGQELEFTAVAYAHYVKPIMRWSNRFGETYGFDQLAEALLTRDLSKCACYGTHVLYALTILLAVHEKEAILSDRVAQQAKQRLKRWSADLETNQSPAGWWDGKWTTELRGTPSREKPVEEWIRCTGHHLEWIAFAPEELRPSDKNIQAGIKFLLNCLTNLETAPLSTAYYFNAGSHAGRALVLLSGKEYAKDFLSDDWSKRRRKLSDSKATDPLQMQCFTLTGTSAYFYCAGFAKRP